MIYCNVKVNLWEDTTIKFSCIDYDSSGTVKVKTRWVVEPRFIISLEWFLFLSYIFFILFWFIVRGYDLKVLIIFVFV